MVSNPSNKVRTEVIDEVILRLLGLKPGVEIDYQTYHDIIKKKLAIVRLAGKEIPREEDELLREEFKRVRREKDKGIRFKIKKARVKKSPQAQTQKSDQKQLPSSGAIVLSKKGMISAKDIIPAKTEEIEEKKKNNFSQIKKTLDSIIKILGSKFKFDKKQQDEDRKEKEIEKRGKKEASLEGFKKGVAGIVATTKKMLSPFQNVIDRIWRFIFFTLLGRAFTKFMDWMSDNQNRKKFDALIEFLADHWPAIAGLYILFGTSFGKLVRGLLKGATRMIVALAMNIPKLIRFVKSKPKIAGLILSGTALASGYLSREVSNIFADKETPESGLIPTKNPELDDAKKSIDQAKNTKIPQNNQGGIIQKFNIGGLVSKFNIGGLIPSFKMGGFNLFGGIDLQSGVPITGAGQDDTLIAAKTGEAILTEKDQIDLNQRYVERNTGDPLNIPQYLSGRKPGFVNADKIGFKGRFPAAARGGIIQKFNEGGIVGGLDSLARNTFGRVGEAYGRHKGKQTGIPGGGWIGEQLGRGKGEKIYDKITSPFRGFKSGGIIEMKKDGSLLQRKKDINNMKMAGSLINILPTDTMSDRSMSGFPQYTEEMLNNKNRNEVKPFQKGGIVNNIKNFFGNILTGRKAKAIQMKPSWHGPAPIPEYKTPEGKALLRTIRTAEHYKGANPYNSIYGGKTAPITKMTVQEVIQMANTGKLPKRFGGGSAGYASGSAATGAYQFMPFTLQNLINKNLVKPSDVMTQELQDRLGWELASNRGVNIHSLKKSGLSQNIMDKMAPEWASFPYSRAGGSSYYGQPVKSADFLRTIYKQGLTKRQNGGFIPVKKVEENEGTKIPGATADRRLFPIIGGGKAALQPGEYVLPVDTVNHLGLSFIEKLVANTDSNSSAYLKKGSINKPQGIKPYQNFGTSGMSGINDIVTLPPIVQSAASGTKARASGYGGGSRVPSFSHVSDRNDRNIVAQIYGIEDII